MNSWISSNELLPDLRIVTTSQRASRSRCEWNRLQVAERTMSDRRRPVCASVSLRMLLDVSNI
jgi:hypothetical protein